MVVFGPVHKQQENAGLREPADQVGEEFLRGLVDPLQVFHGQNQGPFLGLADQQVPDRLKSLFPFLFRLQLNKGLVLDR